MPPEEKTYEQQNPPNVARGDSAVWIRPDGTAYRKAAGGHSWAVHKVEKKPKPKPTPDPDKPAPGSRVQSTKSGARHGGEVQARAKVVAAEKAAEAAVATEKYAPWTSRETDTGTGGLGDRAKKAAEGRASAQDAGDALAKKKKKEDE